MVMTFLRQHAAVLVACLFVVGLFGKAWWGERQARIGAELTSKRLNDSTVVLVASQKLTRAERDSLRGLLTAGKETGGKVIGGTSFRVPKRDTVVIHDTVPTELHADSTRVGTLLDSTSWYQLKVTATAPRCCEPLRMEYSLTRPAFHPTVGFIQKGDSIAASVVWQGETVEVTSAYHVPMPKNPRLVPYLEAFVDPFGRVNGGGGVQLRTFFDLNIAAEAHVGVNANYVGVGLRKEFR